MVLVPIDELEYLAEQLSGTKLFAAPVIPAGMKLLPDTTQEERSWPETTEKTPQNANEDTIGAVASTAMLGGWMLITDRLPESGKPVLVACGKKVLRATHAGKFALSEEAWGRWNDGYGADYNEANDTTYWPEGWYEWNDYEEIHWQLENEPTHWMPLPEAPNALVQANGAKTINRVTASFRRLQRRVRG